MRRMFGSSKGAEDISLEMPSVPNGVLQICHPEWRGVREAAYAFGDPVLESDNLVSLADWIPKIAAAGTATAVIQGWPPGAATFAAAAAQRGIQVLAVFHSSPAQHGIDGGEAEALNEVFGLRRSGALSGIATVKAGTDAAYRALGFEVAHIKNRVPKVGDVEATEVGNDTNAGIFLYPMWRKNVTTQILAVHQLGWKPHVMDDPHVAYLSPDDLNICGELPRTEFLSLQAAMDISLNVTLSECHPMMPMESYRLGVPCLTSRTSDLFLDDPDLYELTTTDRSDNPDAIATASARLLADRDEAVERANRSLDRTDRMAASLWRSFTNR